MEEYKKWYNEIDGFNEMRHIGKVTLIAEHYGIINYVVRDNIMIFFEKHCKGAIAYPDRTVVYKETFNLDTMENIRVEVNYRNVLKGALNIA